MESKQASHFVESSFMGLNMKVPGPTRPAGKESISCISPSTDSCPEVMALSLKLMSVTLPSIDSNTFTAACSPDDDELLMWLARSTIAQPSISQEASCIVHFGIVLDVAKRNDARDPLLE